jgi:adenine-specific DNA-methyltransferase
MKSGNFNFKTDLGKAQMKLNILTPRKSLNKAFLKIKPNRNDIESFKSNFIKLLNHINETESEEFHKNLVSEFLKDTYYKENYYINTKGRNDLVIHNGKDAKSTVGVIIEAKQPANKMEALRIDNINVKAFQELVLYYLRERITLKNLEVKYLIATNIYEWFIFDAHLFERLFANNKQLIKKFTAFEEKRLADTRTDFFYKEIAAPFINDVEEEITFAYFDIRDFDKPLRNADKQDDNKLIALYKLLSPEHLLKLPFTNDSNTLDKSFYTELLHLIGLAETKEGGKKLIGRKKESDRDAGSLIESAIIQLDSLDKISRLENAHRFGATDNERLFNVALELSITWINRILFLKLLEAQLVKYNKGDKSFSFLNTGKIKNFDDLNSLFFQVLARKPEERNAHVKKLFANVPYLNSSLFEPTEIEHECFFISQLKDMKLPVINSTVLKDKTGKKISGALDTLEYIFDFLDAYDFGGDGSEEIQEDNKTLINASVLGLIFEKINGYKDGSFFTPGFITMYMCRETIRRAVVQKFNDVKKWKCQNINQLYNKIENRQEANQIINSLKICDPAVGSGHFLVSALNEIIAIKNDLKILSDRDGRRLKEYSVEVVSDEMIVTDEDGRIFEYNPRNKESQRIQETLFHEKQTIIENCLFGVDINPNSVKICRLRLWIELLKNAYYKVPSYTELETLPNIDINIKCGNSLISRYPLDADIKEALKKSKWNIDSYRLAVMTYRNAENKSQKQEMEKLIDEIKRDFESKVIFYDRRIIRLGNANEDMKTHVQQTPIFELSKKDKSDWENKLKKLTAEIKKLETELEEEKNNKIYENAFEWRFEFPEVINDNGDFVGFDVVIGNPPYGLFNKKQNKKIALTTEQTIIDLLKNTYPEATGGVINAARIFYAFSFKISSKNGFQSMIIPYGVLTDTTSANLRKHLFLNHSLIKVEAFPERDNTKHRVFEDVKMSTAILITSYNKFTKIFDLGISYDRKIEYDNRVNFNSDDLIKFNPDLAQIPLTDSKSFKLLIKLYKDPQIVKLGNISKCLTGEVDMTFGKKALTVNPEDKKLLKGVQIDKYVEKNKKEEISQGEIEYLNIVLFKDLYAGKKLDDSNVKRIALQGLTGVNEKNRLKGTIIEAGTYLSNSCNYILKSSKLELEVILAWLNSRLLNFVFKTKSTSSNVNGYEVDDLPIIIEDKDSRELKNIVDKILAAKKQNPNADTRKLESEIDKLVYELYGLTDEEIAIVEESYK